MHNARRLRKILADFLSLSFTRNKSGEISMRNQNTRKQSQVKDVEHTATVVLVLILTVASFAAGYYFAAMQAASMVTGN
jgi:hypothetical protein